MKKVFMSLAVLAGLATAMPAMAGFTATTGPDVINNTDLGAPGAGVGDSFAVNQGTFGSYLPTGPNDPQIAGDLPSFGYTLNGTVTSVSGNVVDYSGTYRIFYDLNGNNSYDPGTDTSVSFGNTNLQAIFASGNTAAVTGSLTQTAGPSGPFAGSFADFGARYENNPATYIGTYVGGISNPLVGTIGGTITQSAVAVTPLPSAASMGLGMLAVVGAASMLRKKLRVA
jgi:hypothetical protein